MTTKTAKTRRKVYYKVVSVLGGCLWPPIAPSSRPYGRGWHSVTGPLVQCRNGYHVALPTSIRYWWEEYVTEGRRAIYEVAIGQEQLHIAYDRDDCTPRSGAKICARRMKLLRRVTIAELQKRGHWKREK